MAKRPEGGVREKKRFLKTEGNISGRMGRS